MGFLMHCSGAAASYEQFTCSFQPGLTLAAHGDPVMPNLAWLDALFARLVVDFATQTAIVRFNRRRIVRELLRSVNLLLELLVTECDRNNEDISAARASREVYATFLLEVAWQ